MQNMEQEVYTIIEEVKQIEEALSDTGYEIAKAKMSEILAKCCEVIFKPGMLQFPLLKQALELAMGSITKQWVEISCKHVVDEGLGIDTVYNLEPKIAKLSMKINWAILMQELIGYKDIGVGQELIKKPMRILLQKVYIPFWFGKAKTQIRKEITVDKLWTGCLSEAIVILEKIPYKRDGERNCIGHQVCAAYCLRELCALVSEPYSELATLGDIVADISHVNYSEEILKDKIVCMLYSIYDFLQLKGFMTYALQLMKIIIRVELKNNTDKRLLRFLCETQRLSHALCISPVNMELIQTLSNEFDKMDSSVLLFEEDDFISVGFQYNFSYLFSSLRSISGDRVSRLRSDITIEEVDKAAKELISKGFEFVAGYLYLNLSQRCISNGKLLEAFCFATRAKALHLKVFNKKFTGSSQCFENGSLEIPFDSLSREVGDNYYSVWKILQCFLESSYQLAMIHEMIGDATEAIEQLTFVSKISVSLKLPLFVIAFSSLLGKIHCKSGYFPSGERQLYYAERRIKECNGSLCFNCERVFEVTLDECIGEMNRLKSDNHVSGASEEMGKNKYIEALEKLKKWEEKFSRPHDVGGTSEDLKCNFFGDFGQQIREQKRARKSDNLLEELVDLKWIFFRRKLTLRLLSRLAECCGNYDQHKYIMRSISMMVGENMNNIAVKIFRELLAKDIPYDVFVFERADIIYNVCWFTLESFHNRSCIHVFNDSPSLEDLVDCLRIAFLFSREFPVIRRKVSLLISVMYYVSVECKANLQLSSHLTKDLSDMWCFYFHHASIGAHFTWKLFAHLNEKICQDANASGSCKDIFSALTLTESSIDFEHTERFLKDLPQTAIVGISVLGIRYRSLLQNLLHFPAHTEALMMLSRLSSGKKIHLKLLPITSILQASGDLVSTSSTYLMYEKPEDWNCNWGYSVVDHIAPVYRTILEENHFSIKPLKEEYSGHIRDVKKPRRVCIDQHLQTFLREIEESWFGLDQRWLLGEQREAIVLVLDKELQKQSCYSGATSIWLFLTAICFQTKCYLMVISFGAKTMCSKGLFHDSNFADSYHCYDVWRVASFSMF